MKEISENAIVRFKNLSKKFGDFYAVSNVNIEINNGEIVGFLGPNGAGKSTTMKMMAYLLKPTEGEIWIRVNGNLEKLSNHNKDYLLDNVGFLIENPFFYGNVSPRMILKYFAELKGYPIKKVNQRIEDVIDMFGLSDWIDKKIKTFSKGMRQKIGIASAIIHNPDIVVLDEPTTGLDPQARREVRDFILKLKKIGKTIFLSSHLLYEVSEVADRIAIINRGKIVAFDTLDNLEAKAKKSVIHIELLNHPEEQDLNNILDNLKEILTPLTGITKDLNWIKYNHDTKTFQIFFNGDPKNQFSILKTLLANNFEVIEFSVPKAGLLENLFIDLVSNSVSNPSDNGFNKIENKKSILMEE
ncbi:MAG: ABC transporter ATP-binding protein [Candidatus Lokiarchaeota archaeon]|nr:ABC transporter ATP-binding protein [Candidatus Lokiarchaeota archaeon]